MSRLEILSRGIERMELVCDSAPSSDSIVVVATGYDPDDGSAIVEIYKTRHGSKVPGEVYVQKDDLIAFANALLEIAGQANQ
jgi:hypothetical protein